MDARTIRFEGRELGDLSIDSLYRMVNRGKINSSAEYWSEKNGAWMPLVGIMCDGGDARHAALVQSGVTKIKVLGADKSDCPACKKLQNSQFAVQDMPLLPPDWLQTGRNW